MLRRLFKDKYMMAAIGIALAAFALYLFRITVTPNGLYWDEMDVGYQAFSFLKTGKDYFGNSLPIHFQSFADFRTPLYLYAAVPSVALFGLSALAVRLPAAEFGAISVFLIYLVTVEFTNRKYIGLLAAVMLALVPWHFHYSRQAFEATLLLLMFLFGLFAFWRSSKDPRWLPFSAIGFGLCTYAYSTAKLFIPIFVGFLGLIYLKELLRMPKKYLITAILLFIIIGIPIAWNTFQGSGNRRFSEISIFTEQGVVPYINEMRRVTTMAQQEDASQPNLYSILRYNKPVYFGSIIANNYAAAYSAKFLFLSGDQNLRHNAGVNKVGQLYPVMLILLLLGFYAIYVYRHDLGKKSLILLFWILLAPLAAAITREGNPHATRLYFLLPALIVTCSLGAMLVVDTLRGAARAIVITILSGIFFMSAVSFQLYYHTVFRYESAQEYDYAINQTILRAAQMEDSYDKVIIDAGKDSALMSYLFLRNVPPQEFIARHPLPKENLTPVVDGYVFNKTLLLFAGKRDWTTLANDAAILGKSLLFIEKRQLDQFGISDPTVLPYKLIDTVTYPDNRPAFFVYEVNN